MEDAAGQDVASKVRDLMAELRSDLEALVRIPSVSAPGRIDQPLLDAFEMTSRPFAEAGGVEPQTVPATYRVGDSPVNVLTPLMPYFALMVDFAARYQKDAGIGTVIALMIPYTLIITVAWVLFFIAWYLIGIPVGPGWPIR